MSDIPLFPNPADVIAEAADRERHLTIDERLARLSSLIAVGRALSKGISGEEGRRRAKLRLEEEAQRAHREIFERYGR